MRLMCPEKEQTVWGSGSCGYEMSRSPPSVVVILKVFGSGLEVAMHGVSGEAKEGSLGCKGYNHPCSPWIRMGPSDEHNNMLKQALHIAVKEDHGTRAMPETDQASCTDHSPRKACASDALAIKTRS